MLPYTSPVSKTQITKKKKSVSGSQFMASISHPLRQSQCENLSSTQLNSKPLSQIPIESSISISILAQSPISPSSQTLNFVLQETISFMLLWHGLILVSKHVINPFDLVPVLTLNIHIGNKLYFIFKNQLSLVYLSRVFTLLNLAR